MRHLGMLVAQASYLFLPLIGSALCAAFVMRLDAWKPLKRPIDFGATFRGRRLFGDNKTWRGLAYAVTGCIAVVAVQTHVIGARAADIAVIEYEHASVVLLGAAFGVGATAGELPNSFLKRRLGISPGGRPRGPLVPVFYTLDQVDILFGIWPLLLFWITPRAGLVAASFAVVFVVHQAVSAAGFLLRVRRSPAW